MIFKWFTLLFTAIGLTIFVSCVPRSQSSNGKPNIISPADPLKTQGTVDSGGGNTFAGKPLEAYVINIREHQAFKEFISVLLESNHMQSSLIKNVLNNVIDKKTWYLIPAELKKIPSEKIASAVGAEQAALQDFKQIWLNQNIFEKMSIKDQSLLIIHELLMGIRLLKFDSAISECLAFKVASQEESFCRNSYSSEVRGKPSDLDVVDYAQIRLTAKKMSDDGPNISEDDLNDLLGTQGFSTSIHQFKTKASQKIMSLLDLGKVVKTSMLTKSWPTFGFDFNKLLVDHPALLKPGAKFPNITWISDQNCDFSIVVAGDKISISLNEKSGKKIYSSRWDSPIEANLKKDQLTGQYLYNVTTPTLKMTEVAQQGDEILFVTLQFLNDFLQGAYIEKAVCLDSECHQTAAAVDSFKLMCYTRASLQLNSQN